MKTVDIIVPLYNEENILPTFLDSLCKCLNDLSHLYHFKIIAINDGSEDATWNQLTNYTPPSPHLEIKKINLTRNFGKEASLRAGFDLSDSDYLITMDGDGEHPVDLIPVFLDKLEQHSHPIVMGVRSSYENQPKLARRIFSLAFNKLFSKLFNIEIAKSSDFMVFTSKVKDQILKMNQSHPFLRAQIQWTGFNILNVEFQVPNTDKEKSSWTYFKLFKYGICNILGFTHLYITLIYIKTKHRPLYIIKDLV